MSRKRDARYLEHGDRVDLRGIRNGIRGHVRVCLPDLSRGVCMLTVDTHDGGVWSGSVPLNDPVDLHGHDPDYDRPR